MRARVWAMALALTLACAGGAATATAEVGAIVPGTVNFQARLARMSEGTATPLTGIQHVAFRLYDAAEGGTLVWARAFPVTCTVDGTFNIVLDDGGSILGSPAEEKLVDAFQGTERYFELEVEGVGTLKPRMRVPTAPYAFQAQYALWGTDGFEAGATMSVADDAEFVGPVAVSGQGTVSDLTVTAGGGTLGSLTAGGTVSVPPGMPNEGLGTIPVGGIIAWTQNWIPDGWALCDGQDGRPDLQGWFVMGANDTYGLGATGGVARVVLKTDQIPKHDHSYIFPSNEDADRSLNADQEGHLWRIETTKQTDNCGNDEAHENRPPYLAVYYIIRVR